MNPLREVISMFGYGGRRWRHWWSWTRPTVPSGYTYVGPCRCGWGPHAFYQDPSGRIVHAWQVCGWQTPPTPTEEDIRAEVERLKETKSQLEKRIEELERKLKEKES